MNSSYTMDQKEWCVKKRNEGMTYKEITKAFYEKFGLKPDKSTVITWYMKAIRGTLKDEKIPKMRMK